MSRFTPLQGQYLAFIDAYSRVHGHAPAEADLQRHFSVTPPSVHQMILTLERKHLISRVPGVGRSIQLRISTAELPSLARSPFPARISQTGSDRRPVRKAMPAVKMKAAENARAKPDPAAEYIDSPLVAHRLRHERQVSASIDGRYGVYRVTAPLTRRVDGSCTCPSDLWPCKHVRALRATWDVNPDSFFDLRNFLRSLEVRDKRDLVEAIRRIVAPLPGGPWPTRRSGI